MNNTTHSKTLDYDTILLLMDEITTLRRNKRGITEPLVQEAAWDWDDNHPAFGSRYVRYFITVCQPLPACAEHIYWIKRLYDNIRHGVRNEALNTAASWEQGGQRHRTMIRVCLIAPNTTPATICAFTGLDPIAIDAYAQLYFNVLDRRDDTVFIDNIAYAKGPGREFSDPEYFKRETAEQRLLRASYVRGMPFALNLMGIPLRPDRGPTSSEFNLRYGGPN